MSDAKRSLHQLRQAVDSARVATGRRTTELSREGRYLEAVAALEADLASWPALLAPYPAAETRPILAKWTKWQLAGIAALRQRAAWAEKASTELEACRALLLDLLQQTRWDVDCADVRDARVQVLLDAARSLDLRAMKLFSANRVHVVVEAPELTELQRAAYAQGLAEDLGALGVRASAKEGDARFLVTATVDGPHPVHFVHDTFCECTLRATATWEGSGLGPIDLKSHASGDEEVDDCVENSLEKGKHLAAKAVLLAWAATRGPVLAEQGAS